MRQHSQTKRGSAIRWHDCDAPARQAERTTESLCPEKELCGRAKTEIDLTSRLRAPPIPRYSSSPTNTHKASQNRHMHYIRPSPRTPDHPNHSFHSLSLSLLPALPPLPSTSVNHSQPKCDTRHPDDNLDSPWDLNPAESPARHPRVSPSGTLPPCILPFDHTRGTCPYLPSDPRVPLRMDTRGHISH